MSAAVSDVAASSTAAVLPRTPTRAAYQRALCLLPQAWPELCQVHPELTDADFYFLSRMLAKKPGWWQYMARRNSCEDCSRPVKDGGTGKWTEVRASGVCRLCGKTAKPRDVRPGMAEEIGWGRLKLLKSTKRLRAAGLLLGELLTQRDRLPTGRYADTNILRYFVLTHVIESAAFGSAHGSLDGSPGEPSSGSVEAPSPGSLGSVDAPSPTPPRSTPRITPSPRPPAADHEASETPPGDKATRPNRKRRRDPVQADPTETEKHRLEGEQAEDHAVDGLVKQWDALELPEESGTVSVCRPSERSAIRNRRREVGHELVRLAILGAGADEYLRRCPRRTAIGWVFASSDSVRKHARLGAEVEAERAEASARGEDLRAKAAVEERRQALWVRAPWVERAAPLPFKRAMQVGDFLAAEAILRQVEDLGAGKTTTIRKEDGDG